MIETEDILSYIKKENKQYIYFNCPFYECELVGEYTHFGEYYLQSEDQPNEEYEDEEYEEYESHEDRFCVDASLNNCLAINNICNVCDGSIKQVECGRQNVTEGIGDHYKITVNRSGKIEKGTKNRWEPSQPVFISAQTGQGKNYFIENTLIPYVRKINYEGRRDDRVLIISNRLALKQQIKDHLDGNGDLEEENYKIYSYDGIVDVMTYQSLLKKKNSLKKRRYLYVICDEAHFFTSDAMFNPDTQKILSTIVEVFRKAVRVYMSATPYDCLEYIIKPRLFTA